MTAPAHHCPIHRSEPLDGGPVQYWCPVTGHNVWDADLDHEYRPAVAR
ncbi:hypothetical protein AB0C10_26945 [Microbispora amethystogenes]